MPCSTERIAVEFIGQGIGHSAESNTGSGWVSRTSHERSIQDISSGPECNALSAMPTFPVDIGYDCFRTGGRQVRGGKVSRPLRLGCDLRTPSETCDDAQALTESTFRLRFRYSDDSLSRWRWLL